MYECLLFGLNLYVYNIYISINAQLSVDVVRGFHRNSAVFGITKAQYNIGYSQFILNFV